MGADKIGALFLNKSKIMEEKEENKNQTPPKMARLAWPKAKYGVALAVIIIIVGNLIYYKDIIFSFLK